MHDECVAENSSPEDEAPTPPRGLPAVPDAAPPGLNADEYRRFQEFQRFQDYQRFVESQRAGSPAHVRATTNPWAPVPPEHDVAAQLAGVRQHLAELSVAQTQINRTLNPPLWQKILRNKWLHRAAWLVIIVIIATWGVPVLVQHFFGDNGSSANESPFKPKTENGLLPPDPKREVAAMYKFVARNDTGNGCFVFSAPAAAEFARAWGVSTCAQAINTLAAQVKDPDPYALTDLSLIQEPRYATTMTISSCSYAVVGGPRLGTFTMTRQDTGWLITGYARPEPSCPTPTTTASAPPTS